MIVFTAVLMFFGILLGLGVPVLLVLLVVKYCNDTRKRQNAQLVQDLKKAIREVLEEQNKND